MTLEQLGNLGEFIGAVAVVVSLLYLATQIRQNSRLLRSAASQAATYSAAQISLPIATDPRVAKLSRDAMRSYEALEEVEKTQADALFLVGFAGYEALYYQFRDGTIEPGLWEGRRTLMLGLLRTPGCAAWWESWKQVFGPEFREYVEGQLSSASAVSTPIYLGR